MKEFILWLYERRFGLAFKILLQTLPLYVEGVDGRERADLTICVGK